MNIIKMIIMYIGVHINMVTEEIGWDSELGCFCNAAPEPTVNLV